MWAVKGIALRSEALILARKPEQPGGPLAFGLTICYAMHGGVILLCRLSARMIR
jgi:hypothetical protein